MATIEKRQLICDRCSSAEWGGKHAHHYANVIYARMWNANAASPTQVDLCRRCYDDFLKWFEAGKKEVARADTR